MKILPEYPRCDQAQRAADYLAFRPKSTAREIEDGADVPDATKLVSVMHLELGFKFTKSTRRVECVQGTRCRTVRTYTLISRPKHEQDTAQGELPV